jgi:hypothetical protein
MISITFGQKCYLIFCFDLGQSEVRYNSLVCSHDAIELFLKSVFI